MRAGTRGHSDDIAYPSSIGFLLIQGVLPPSGGRDLARYGTRHDADVLRIFAIGAPPIRWPLFAK
jgi:hypothetical protein